jgi:NAD(P)-dependent dehydrogenase (short-subunit alcohol dehydrogenase family)
MPFMILDNRVALITGAGRGIGRAIALGYAREGARIAAVARSEGELESLAQEIGGVGRSVLTMVADLSDPAAPAGIVAQVESGLGPVDILVNNAGVGSSANPRPVVDFDDDFWHYTLALNLSAPYYFCKAVLPGFLRRKWGRIINIASLNSKVPSLHGVAYAASKHGLLGLTRTLALEVAKDGITVNAICPGPVRTVINDKRIQYDAERLGITVEEIEQRSTPIGRRLTPEEMVPMAVLLAADAAACITGQAFNVCGGLVMS